MTVEAERKQDTSTSLLKHCQKGIGEQQRRNREEKVKHEQKLGAHKESEQQNRLRSPVKKEGRNCKKEAKKEEGTLELIQG